MDCILSFVTPRVYLKGCSRYRHSTPFISSFTDVANTDMNVHFPKIAGLTLVRPALPRALLISSRKAFVVAAIAC